MTPSLALHRTAACAFYVLGVLAIAGIAALRFGMAWVTPLLHALDLPLIAAAMIYGGMSFHRSIARPGRSSLILGAVVAVLLAALFVFFAYLNFAFAPPSAALP